MSGHGRGRLAVISENQENEGCRRSLRSACLVVVRASWMEARTDMMSGHGRGRLA